MQWVDNKICGSPRPTDQARPSTASSAGKGIMREEQKQQKMFKKKSTDSSTSSSNFDKKLDQAQLAEMRKSQRSVLKQIAEERRNSKSPGPVRK